MIATIKGIVGAWAYDEDDQLVGEVHALLTARPGPDGWTVDVAAPTTPDQVETVVLHQAGTIVLPGIEAAVAHLLATTLRPRMTGAPRRSA